MEMVKERDPEVYGQLMHQCFVSIFSQGLQSVFVPSFAFLSQESKGGDPQPLLERDWESDSSEMNELS